jgi:hypothetical protein
MVEKSEREEDFTHRATKVTNISGVSQTTALDVEVVHDGEFYDEGEELRAMHDNIMSLDELEKFMKKGNREIKFNDPEMNI